MERAVILVAACVNRLTLAQRVVVLNEALRHALDRLDEAKSAVAANPFLLGDQLPINESRSETQDRIVREDRARQQRRK
jgi:hypothetical protein